MNPQIVKDACVLIVDDTLKNIQVLGTVLKRKGFNILVAQNGKQALKLAKSSPPDLILLDVMMPEIDGFETCKQLKKGETTKDIPVIFLTAKVEETDIVKGFEMGGVDYITKPFNPSELLARVDTHLTLRFLQKNLESLVAQRTEEVVHTNDRLQQTNEIYSRFVPREFLHLLKHESITDIRLGDQIELEMTILFSDIVSFTNISEKMSPKENFGFVNQFLSQVSPVIREHHGFVDKYMGDGIMALFPGTADDAVAAAVGMMNVVNRLRVNSQKTGQQPISIGIGLHTGRLMLGVIGEENRMETSVISNSVNLAARLESLTRRYKVGIVISEQTLLKLKNKDGYLNRCLEKVQVKGMNEPVTVYEIFDADGKDNIERKSKTKSEFEKALSLFWSGDFTKANLHIAHVLAENPNDIVFQLYQRRIAEAIANGTYENWSGVERLTSK